MSEFFEAYPLVLAAAIFLACIVDVTLETVRMITVVRGNKVLSVVIGFFEIIIWVAAIGQVLANLDRWYLILAYAGGFAAGNLAGIWLEDKLALGDVLVHAMSRNDGAAMAAKLRAQGYAVTELRGIGERETPVEVAIIAVQRRQVPALMAAIQTADPGASCTIEDVRRLYRPKFIPLAGFKKT